ncbi:hypothetical protein CPB86DRAFT_878742 [Serendipita vermifera]|nr:hypothetical protein CPB86DRAFT_878742 [Serendipita vermifera]
MGAVLGVLGGFGLIAGILKAFSSEEGLKPNPVLKELEDAAAKKQEEETKNLKEEVERLKEAVKNLDKSLMGPDNKPTEQEIAQAKEKHNYNDKYVNIALCGRTRTGKSSLINAFRGYRDGSDDPQVAPVGIVETTSEVTSYADPDPTKPFIWYDFPGAGTLNIPEWDYFNQQGLFIFDFIIVLYKDTLAQTDIAILRECDRLTIPSYLVRSHADSDIEKVLKQLPGYDRRNNSNNGSLHKEAVEIYKEKTKINAVKILKDAGLAQRKFYRISRDNIEAIVKHEPPYSTLVDEEFLLRDCSKELVSRRV